MVATAPRHPHLPHKGGDDAKPTATPTPPPDGSAAGGFKVGGKRVSWDAVFMVAGLVGAFLFYRRSAKTSAPGTTVIQGSLPPPAAASTVAAIAGNPATTLAGGNWWDQLYASVDQRAANADGSYGDPGGRAFWASETDTKGQAAAVGEFLATPEAAVQTDYAASLGRSADPGGLRFYTNQIQSGNLTAAQVAAQIAQSPEAKRVNG